MSDDLVEGLRQAAKIEDAVARTEADMIGLDGRRVGSVNGKLLREAASALEARDAEIARLRRENTIIRAALAVSKDPCVYCKLPAEEMAKCKHGFPGCGRADDVLGCPEFGASMHVEELQDEIARLKEALRPFARSLAELEAISIKLHDRPISAWSNGTPACANVRIEDLRRAASLLRELEQNPPEKK